MSTIRSPVVPCPRAARTPKELLHVPDSPPMTAPRHAVWGRVLDAAGEPAPGSLVYWLDGGPRGPAPPLDLHPVGWAGVDGAFCAMDLPPGECLLVADCEEDADGIRGA